MDSEKLFEAALGLSAPWYVRKTAFNAGQRTLTIAVDCRFAHPDVEGLHPVHDTQSKRYRHLNFFQHECYLEVRVPRVKRPDDNGHYIETCVPHIDILVV